MEGGRLMGMWRDTIVITAGASGAGTAYSSRPIAGDIISVRLAGTALGGTADFTLTREGDGGTVLVVTNGQGPWQYQPRDAVHSTSGGTTAYNLGTGPVFTDYIPSADYLKLTVAQAAASAAGTVFIHYRE